MKAPSGDAGVVVTMFLPMTGAAKGEVGELIYWKKLVPDPVIAAAGDIACDPSSASYNGGLGTATSCRQQATSDLLMGGGLAGVLTLGDNQYENGTLPAYRSSFEPTWGRVKSIIHPVPGNHEYQTRRRARVLRLLQRRGQRRPGLAGERGKGYYSYRHRRLAHVRAELELRRSAAAAASARRRSCG